MWIQSYRDEYFRYLLNKLEDEPHDHSDLLKCLFDVDFHSCNKLDDNRAYDAYTLRCEYVQEHGNSKKIDTAINVHPVSVLEVLYALARRIENDVMQDDFFGDRTSSWFWQMIYNIGLLNCTNDKFNADKVYDIVTAALDGNIEEDGTGGFFRLRKKGPNMREADLWGQAMSWLVENFM